MNLSRWAELREALMAVGALMAFLALVYALLVPLPLWPFLVGEAVGATIGLSLLVVLSPARQS